MSYYGNTVLSFRPGVFWEPLGYGRRRKWRMSQGAKEVTGYSRVVIPHKPVVPVPSMTCRLSSQPSSFCLARNHHHINKQGRRPKTLSFDSFANNGAISFLPHLPPMMQRRSQPVSPRWVPSLFFNGQDPTAALGMGTPVLLLQREGILMC